MTRNRKFLIAAAAAIALLGGLAWWAVREPSGDPALRPFTHGAPRVAVVFTSRTGPSSLRAAAAPGDYERDALIAPGRPQWQAREGRLRILTPSGRVRELTWDKPLPDGGTLVDVMSPSITLDGKSVLFAGRREGGRFRLHIVGLDGSGLRPLTGGDDDPGCVAVPPARFHPDGRLLTDDERKATDYDDVDPAELPGGAIVFASSRIPDLGGRDTRATQLWIKRPDKQPRPLTASRANDRWPFVSLDGRILFSLWSRVDEVVAADGGGLVRSDPATPGLTAPADNWIAADILPSGEHFAGAVKVAAPVWRPRPLANGKIVFMTPVDRKVADPSLAAMTLVQAEPGTTTNSPSSLAAGGTHPTADPSLLAWASTKTNDGREWSLATPSPYSRDRLLVAAAPLTAGRPDPGGYGIYHASQDGWTAHAEGNVDLVPLFDDPNFVDAEPVAAYPRAAFKHPLDPPKSEWGAEEKQDLTLPGGKRVNAVAGRMHAADLLSDVTGKFIGQTTDAGTGPIIPPFPAGSIERIIVYSTGRDRFDDPQRPVVRGPLERLADIPVTGPRREFFANMPVGDPTLLIGVDKEGRVAKVTGAADASGRRGTFYAYAGDHFSGTRAGSNIFCNGCHAGHTFHGANVAEKFD